MKIDLDIAKIREKALLIVDKEDEEEFLLIFDQGLYEDVIENTEDYIAEGVAAHFKKQY